MFLRHEWLQNIKLETRTVSQWQCFEVSCWTGKCGIFAFIENSDIYNTLEEEKKQKIFSLSLAEVEDRAQRSINLLDIKVLLHQEELIKESRVI